MRRCHVCGTGLVWEASHLMCPNESNHPNPPKTPSIKDKKTHTGFIVSKPKEMSDNDIKKVAETIMANAILWKVLDKVIERHGITLGMIQKYIQRKTMNPDESIGKVFDLEV